MSHAQRRARCGAQGWLALACAASLAGCAGQAALRPRQVGSGGEVPTCGDSSNALAQLRGQPAAPSSLIAAVTDGSPRELLVYDASNHSVRWRKQVAAQARPELHGELVVTLAEGHVLGFDASNGELRVRTPAPHPAFVGSAARGALLYFVTSTPASALAAGSSALSAFDRTRNAIVWTRELAGVAGRPQLANGLVLTLEAHRELRAFDAQSGAEVACVALDPPGQASPQLARWLRVSEHGVLYGDTRARVLGTEAGDELAGEQSNEGPWSWFPADELVVPASRSAYGRVDWISDLAIDPARPQHARASLVLHAFYRALFAYSGDGKLVWARSLDSDLVRAVIGDTEVLALMESGTLLALDRSTGALRARAPILAASGKIASADIAATRLVAGSDHTEPALPLRRALTAIAGDSDTRLLPAREVAIDALAQSSEPAASCDLLDVYRARSTPERLRRRIAERLRERSTGSECLLSALDVHADFLTGTSAPPLEALVPAVVSQRVTAALPRLIEHLFDPATPASQLAPLIDAIDALGEDAAREPLERFRRLYAHDSALAATPGTLELLERALSERHADVEPQRGGAQSPATASAPTPEAKATVAAATPVPEVLGDAEIRAALRARRAGLDACLAAASARDAELRAARLSFVVTGRGALHALSVLPDRDPALAQCVGSELGQAKFPRSKSGSRPTTYLLVRPSPSAPAPQPGDAHASDFWSLSKARAGAAHEPSGAPWWRNQNPLFVSIEPGGAAGGGAKTPTPNLSPASNITKPAESTNGSASTPAQPAAAPASAPAAPQPPAAADDAWWLPTTAPR